MEGSVTILSLAAKLTKKVFPPHPPPQNFAIWCGSREPKRISLSE